ncbi:MAG: hypothetical protein WC175_05040 [Candidatus Dojkabacteria bacterium]
MREDVHNIKIEFSAMGSKRAVDKILEKIVKLLEKSDIRYINTDFSTSISITEDKSNFSELDY